MSNFKNNTLIVFCLIFIVGCKQLDDQEKYQSPDWLAGKIYTQITTLPDLSDFKECLQLTGYDSILDVSGSYTVFAPNNAAFQNWFKDHPEYSQSLGNVPVNQLTKLVEQHIIQNSWSKEQIRSLNTEGWIDKNDPNNDKPYGYKRQTIFKNPNKKYFINDLDNIVDSTFSRSYKKVFTSSRKYSPLFYDEYFAVNNIKTSDYAFYYTRNFEGGNIYYGNSKIIGAEIFAENGFIYTLDEVTKPLYNAEELLSNGKEKYGKFQALINKFSVFSLNLTETNLQPEVIAGKAFDYLYNLSFNGLSFNPNEELTGPNTNNANYTVRYQNGLLAPTNEAMQSLYDNLITKKSGYPHWSDIDDIPSEVNLLLLNSQMSKTPIYESNLVNGFENAAGDIVKIDKATIIDKYYGSNGSFIGLNKAVIPRAFTSITGPIYLRPGYSVMRKAVVYSNTLPALKKTNQEYAFYIIPDEKCNSDSLLMVDGYSTSFRAFDRSILRISSIPKNQLTTMILNHVGTRLPRGIARKEFIENLASNFIIVNNEKNTVSGGASNTFGYNGDSTITVNPVALAEVADNGRTYEVRTWFSMPQSTMYSSLLQYPHFLQLIKDAGLFNNVYYSFPFITEGEYYTVFVPTVEALNKVDTKILTLKQKQDLVKHHFIRGARIWTDGSNASKKYETLCLDKSSGEFQTKYQELNIATSTDVIKILDDYSKVICEINEKEGATNQMVSTRVNNYTNERYNFVVTSVMHVIDTVLINY